MSDLSAVTAAEQPDLVEGMLRLGASPWPEFLDHDEVVNRHWGLLYELAADWQFALVDGDGALAAVGNCIPFRWDGDPAHLPDRGIDRVLEDGVDCLRSGARPTAASALMIVLDPGRLGTGLSGRVIRAMAGVVADHGVGDLVAPVRPTRKEEHPLVAMEDYIGWRRDDGTPFDPWIRVHERVGGEILGPCPAAMRVTGTVADWEEWTGMTFAESGAHVVPGGLVPVSVDRERDFGEYVEPGCWIRHRLG